MRASQRQREVCGEPELNAGLDGTDLKDDVEDELYGGQQEASRERHDLN